MRISLTWLYGENSGIKVMPIFNSWEEAGTFIYENMNKLHHSDEGACLMEIKFNVEEQ